MHSATKFIAGHSDVMAGVLAVKGEKCVSSSTSLIPLSSVFEIPSYYICQQISRLAKELYFLQNSEGSGLAPFDCWICLRGIKTMALRIEKQQVNGVLFLSSLLVPLLTLAEKNINRKTQGKSQCTCLLIQE